MIRHIAGIAEIVEDMQVAVGFYRDVLGLPVEHEEGSGYALVQVPGVLHFGIWLRKTAAESVFGDVKAAGQIPLGFTVGFEVDSIDESSEIMKATGWPIAQAAKTEPWGQTTTRFFSASGALSEFSEMPPARRIVQDVKAGPES